MESELDFVHHVLNNTSIHYFGTDFDSPKILYAIFSHNSFNLPNEFDYYSIEGLITIGDDEKNPFHHSFYEYYTQKLQLAKKLTKYYHFLNVTSEYFC